NVSPASLTNTGTLQALNGGTLSIGATTWSSSSTITATNSTLSFSGAWSNTGTITINNSTLNLGGTFTTAGIKLSSFTRTGGTVNVTGTLANSSSPLTLNAATGSWGLAGGTISGGTVAFADSQTLIMTADSSNRLLNVTVSGDLDLAASSARVKIEGTTT